jgi:hypothetical protein
VQIWVTEHVLQLNVRKYDCIEIDANNHAVLDYDWTVWPCYYFFTEAEALADAEAQRSKKIASLEREVEALKAINFSVVDRTGRVR